MRPIGWVSFRSFFSYSYTRPYVIFYGLSLVCIMTLLAAFYVPIYIDDITSMITATRAGYDDLQMIGVRPLCKNNFEAPIPFMLLPGRLLSWLTYLPVSSPFIIRSYGISIFACWLFFVIWMGKKCFPKNNSLPTLAYVVMALGFLGVFPFMATLTRSETPIAIAIAFLALLPFYVSQHSIGERKQFLLIVLILLVCSWLFGAHPKSLFFAPLAFYSLYVLRGGLPWFWVASPSILSLMVLQTYLLAKHRFNCPDSPEMESFLSTISLDDRLLLKNPEGFLVKFIKGLADGREYLQHILFSHFYGSGWLPPTPVGSIHSTVNLLIITIITLVCLICALGISRNIFWAWQQKKYDTAQLIVPLLLIAGLASTAGFQQAKNFYDVIPIWLSLICLLVIFLFDTKPLLSVHARNYIVHTICTISIVSQLLLVYSFRDLPKVNADAGITGELLYEGKSYIAPSTVFAFRKSASMLNYDKRRNAIMDLASRCNIHPEKPQEYLIIDMFTYLVFKNSYRTVFVEHLGDQIVDFAKRIHSTGLITLCHSLPPDLQNKVTSGGGFCCIGKDDFVKIQ